jgi:signal peptidase I
VADLESPPAAAQSQGAPPARRKEEGGFLWFLVKLIIVVLLFRTFVFGMFSIPSESMLPTALWGDYLFTEKWPYGYSQASMPFDLPFFKGRLFGRMPQRGDVLVFKHPVDRETYIKRVIGLPGDTVQVKGGVVYLNGTEVPKVRVADFVAPITPYNPCRVEKFRSVAKDGTPVCRYPRFRETLPGGVSYDVLDFGAADTDNPWGIDADNTQPVIVPEGKLFMMGDNRDDSLDSRFPSVAGEGVGFLPVENVVGRAAVVAFSTDGDARWLNPVSWFRAARWQRIGETM